MVYEFLLKVHRDVPFALRDHFELWLFDARHRPLALMHSVLTETETDTETDPPLDWRAGIAAQTQFNSSALTLTDPPSAYLTRHINGLIDRTPAQWFVRTDDDASLGLRVVGNAQSLKGRVLEAELFPPFIWRPMTWTPRTCNWCRIITFGRRQSCRCCRISIR